MTILKLCAFQNRRNFGNFPKFFYQNFRLNWMCQILMVSSERSLSVLSKLTLFKIEKNCINKNILYMWVKKLNFIKFLFAVFHELLLKYSNFLNSAAFSEITPQELPEEILTLLASCEEIVKLFHNLLVDRFISKLWNCL